MLDRSLADQSGFKPTASGQWVQGGDIPDLPAAQAAALAAEKAKTAAWRASGSARYRHDRREYDSAPARSAKSLKASAQRLRLISGRWPRARSRGRRRQRARFGKWAGGVLGSGAVNAGATATSEAAGGESLSPSDIGISALFGLAGGVPGGVVGRGGKLAPAVSADALHDAATETYKPLSNVLYDATNEVHPTLDVTDAQNALRDWSGYKWGDASKTSKEVNTLLDKPQLSANDIQQSQSYLKGIAKNPTSDPNDALYAAHYVGKLQDVLDNGVPQSGVPQNWSNPTNAPSFASAKKAEGDVLHGQANDVDRLNDWIAKSQVAGGPDVGSPGGFLFRRTQQGQRFAQPGSPGYDALNMLAGTGQGPLSGQGLTLWDLKHHLLWPAVGLAGAQTAGAYGTAEGHQPWWANIPEDIAGLGAGFLLKNRLNAAGVAGQQRAIDAARSALSTGQQQSPVLPTAPLRDWVRQIIYGQGAAGGLPGQ